MSNNNMTNNTAGAPRAVSAREHLELDYRLRNSTSTNNHGGAVFGFFKIVFFVLFIVMVFNVISSNDRVITFTSLLEGLEESPSVSSKWVTSFAANTISSDWGIFNFLRDFINSLIPIISFFLFIINGLVQVVFYFTYIIRTFFVA